MAARFGANCPMVGPSQAPEPASISASRPPVLTRKVLTAQGTGAAASMKFSPSTRRASAWFASPNSAAGRAMVPSATQVTSISPTRVR